MQSGSNYLLPTPSWRHARKVVHTMISIITSRKVPTAGKTSPPLPVPPAADTPPPPVPQGESLQSAAPDVSTGHAPPPPSDASAGVTDAAPIVAALSNVGIPAGLFMSGEVEPNHAAVVLRDHATALGMPADDVTRAVTNALELLHIIGPDVSQRVMSAVNELAEDKGPTSTASDEAENAAP